LGEFPGCRMLKELVEIGLVAIEDAPPPPAKAPAPAAERPALQPPVAPEPAAAQPAPEGVALTPSHRAGASSLVTAARSSQGADGATAVPLAGLASLPAGLAERATRVPEAAAGAGPPAPSSEAEPVAKAAPAQAQATPRKAGPQTEQVGAEVDQAELVQRLADLQRNSTSPAVRHATGGRGTPVDRDGEAPDEELAKVEEPLNRGLLLKFLNSVRS
ncbi:MAG: hypothetical protein LC685_02660, partial [Actinobacteria bacterium]|nr:hypothetical protein [Actinomycetota bacterium]